MSQTAQEHTFYQETITSALNGMDVLEPVTTTEVRRRAPHRVSEGPFGDLSKRLFESFADHIEPHIEAYPGKPEYHWSSTQHGFEVAGRGIARCIEAYNAFYLTLGEQGTTEECTQALLHPQTIRTFTQIAKMTNEENGAYELWLGLKSEGSLSNTFTFKPEFPAFRPDGQRIICAQEEAEAERSEVSDADAPYRVCPAIRYLPMIWSSHVEAAQQEGLLQSALGLASPKQEAAH